MLEAVEGGVGEFRPQRDHLAAQNAVLGVAGEEGVLRLGELFQQRVALGGEGGDFGRQAVVLARAEAGGLRRPRLRHELAVARERGVGVGLRFRRGAGACDRGDPRGEAAGGFRSCERRAGEGEEDGVGLFGPREVAVPLLRLRAENAGEKVEPRAGGRDVDQGGGAAELVGDGEHRVGL